MTSVQAVHEILSRHQVELTLLDLGASANTYKPFQKTEPSAVLVEVDPDSRDFKRSESARRITVNAAITDNDVDKTVTVYLTSNPHCSSTLKPDFKRLRNFPYDDLFEVVQATDVPATSLNRLSKELGRAFDWIKLDTQGTETRILNSMSDSLFDRLICCDVEISFYAHYQGADTFPRLHDLMVSHGFVISDILAIQERVRLRRSDVASLAARGVPQNLMKRWPTSPELRYIRAVNHDEAIEDIDRFLRIWSIAFFTGNHPYCYFLSNRLMESSQHEELASSLQEIAYRRLRRERGKVAVTRVLSRVNRRLD